MPATEDGELRHDWTVEEILDLHETPILELVGRANATHRRFRPQGVIHKSALISVKTGGCSEDCAYCPQSARHHAIDLTPTRLMNPAAVVETAKAALAAGADRFCMGAAWRRPPKGAEFDAVLEMVRGVSALGLETCVTLGELDAGQATRLAEAGLTAYNHNLDTGPDYYERIVTTHSHADRLRTLGVARAAGLQLCCGGIIGMGETKRDRAALLRELTALDPHPEGVPINALTPIPGTPLGDRPPPDPLDMARMIATTRLVLPTSFVRLSAGRATMGREAHILCFLAGADAVFLGDTLLTAPNASADHDAALFAALA